MTELAGKVALVTGGAVRVGRAISLALAAEGMRVVVHYNRSSSAADELCAEIRAGGGEAVAIGGDLASVDEVRRVADEAERAFGGIDVLVNNAGVFFHHPITEVSYEDWQAAWRETLDVNLVGAANVTWCAVRHMKRGGRIVNVSSRGAFRGEPDGPAYGASKAGMNALGQSLAIALAPHGITVGTVAPGFVETDMTNEHLKAPRGDEIRAQSPFGRVAMPEEIAGAVLYLASPVAEWASGTIIDLNGASYLRS
jgi:3-oxoacyl-[acyl-carrier protein] reductase